MLKDAKNLNILLKNGKNTLLFFHLNDCPWCHFVADEVLIPMSEMLEYTNKLNILSVAINLGGSVIYFDNKEMYNDDLATKFKIDFYPTILIFNENGKLLEKIVGVASQDFYWTNLDDILAKY